MKIINALGGRKFVFAETLLVLLAVMVVFKIDLETIKTFFNYAITIFGLYVGGNVVQKFSGSTGETEEVKGDITQ